jgi:hypothetical protein
MSLASGFKFLNQQYILRLESLDEIHHNAANVKYLVLQLRYLLNLLVFLQLHLQQFNGETRLRTPSVPLSALVAHTPLTILLLALYFGNDQRYLLLMLLIASEHIKYRTIDMLLIVVDLISLIRELAQPSWSLVRIYNRLILGTG